jgi:hypothetical protein
MHGKIRPSQNSAEILQQIVNPNNAPTKELKFAKLQSFIGLMQWFSKYVPDCSRLLLPLHNIRETSWEWGDEHQRCFDKCKAALCSIQPLHLPSGTGNRLEVHTDASKDGWFAVLFEDMGEGEPQDRLRVIAYAGGIFRKNQCSWSVLQKEFYAVYQAHLKFDPLIRLHEFRLVVDNKTMTWCETSADMMVQRWYLRIQHYMSEIVHLPGVLNILPDAGSRLLHLGHANPIQAQFQSLTTVLCNLQHSSHKTTRNNIALPALLTSRDLDNALHDLADASPLDATDDWTIRNMQHGHARFCGCDAALTARTCSSSSDDWISRPFPRSAASASTVSIDSEPTDRQPHGSASATMEPLGSQPTSAWLQENFADSASTIALADKAASASSSEYARLAAEPSTARRNLAILPEHVHLIRTCHGGAVGHHGRDETIRKLQVAGHHWPTRFIDVARFIAACPHCQRYRLKQRMPYAMYKHPCETQNRPPNPYTAWFIPTHVYDVGTSY